jgi:hypothetical protein
MVDIEHFFVEPVLKLCVAHSVEDYPLLSQLLATAFLLRQRRGWNIPADFQQIHNAQLPTTGSSTGHIGLSAPRKPAGRPEIAEELPEPAPEVPWKSFAILRSAFWGRITL